MSNGPGDDWDIPFDDSGDDEEGGGWSPSNPWGADVEWERPPEWEEIDWSSADSFEDDSPEVPDDEGDYGEPPEDFSGIPFGLEPDDFGDNFVGYDDLPDDAESRGVFVDLNDIWEYIDEISFLDWYLIEHEGYYELYVDPDTQRNGRSR